MSKKGNSSAHIQTDFIGGMIFRLLQSNSNTIIMRSKRH